MVHFLCPIDTGIERYAETEWDTLDIPLQTYRADVEFLKPDEVHWKSNRENENKKEQGYHVKPDCMPKKVLWANGSRALPDVLPGFIVSSRFKAVVDRFEPNLHQFIPVDIYKARGGVAVATYYWFIVGQRLDSVDREATTYNWQAPPDRPSDGMWTNYIFTREPLEMTEIKGAELIFSNSRTVGRSIWHDPHLPNFGNGLCSDLIASALMNEEVTGLAITPRPSV